MMDANFILSVINAFFSWPTVAMLIILIFFKDLKKLISGKNTSIKAGNFEFSLNDIKNPNAHENRDEKLFVGGGEKSVPSDNILSSKNISESTIKARKLNQLEVYLKTISFQLLAWLFMHIEGKPFSPLHLLKIKHIPIYYHDRKIRSYCVHSKYEKEAIAAEFKRNYWNFIRFNLIEDVGKNNVRIIKDENVLNILKNAMAYAAKIESGKDDVTLLLADFSKNEKSR